VANAQVVHETLAENTAKNEEKKGPMMRVKADPSVSDDSKLESYRFCEETWTMELTDCELQLPGDAPPLRLPRTMIVAVQSAPLFPPPPLPPPPPPPPPPARPEGAPAPAPAPRKRAPR
jgi:hypothetical protein